MWKIAAAIALFCPVLAAAADKEPLDDRQMFSALNIIAVPIGEKGMVVKDAKGCLWVLQNAKGTPVLAAVLGGDNQAPLCEVPKSAG